MNRMLFALAVPACAISMAQAEWSVQLIDTFGVTPSIALDPSGLPGILYYHSYVGMMYAEYDGTQWTEDFIFQPTYGSCQYTGLAIDAYGVPHIAFSSAGTIMYGTRNPGSGQWTLENFAYSFSGDWTSIALDSQGDPRICFRSFNEDLIYLFRTGGEWSSETVDQAADVGLCNSIAVDGDDASHAAYCSSMPVSGVKYALRTGSESWETCFADTAMISDPIGTSLAIDASGNPHISYNTGGEVRYASLEGSTWTIQTVYSVDTGTGEYGTSLVLDQFGYPHIAHCSAGGDSLLYSVNQGEGWQTEGVMALAGYNSGDPDLALDVLARPHTVFHSTQPGSSSLYYAFNSEPSSIESAIRPVQPEMLALSPCPFFESLNIAFELPGMTDAKLRVYDLSGRLVSTVHDGPLGAGGHSAYWRPGPSVPAGQYIVVLEAGEVRASERVVFLR